MSIVKKIKNMSNKSKCIENTKKQIKKKFSIKSLFPKSRKEKYLEMAKIINEYRRNEECITSEDECNKYLEYDEEVSKKFFSFVINLTRLKEKIYISINKKYITINCIDYSKKLPYPSSQSGLKSSDDNLEISINLNGFSIRKDYSNRMTYKDDKMFDKILPIITEKYKEISRSILFETIDDFIVNSGLSREINLEELIKNKEI